MLLVFEDPRVQLTNSYPVTHYQPSLPRASSISWIKKVAGIGEAHAYAWNSSSFGVIKEKAVVDAQNHINYSYGLILTNQIDLYRKNPKNVILQNYFESKKPFTQVHHQAMRIKKVGHFLIFRQYST
jgi:hypothetical protein